MKKNIIAFVVLALILPLTSTAQVDQSEEVRVVEHLGDTIPLDLKFVTDKFDTVTLGQ